MAAVTQVAAAPVSVPPSVAVAVVAAVDPPAVVAVVAAVDHRAAAAAVVVYRWAEPSGEG